MRGRSGDRISQRVKIRIAAVEGDGGRGILRGGHRLCLGHRRDIGDGRPVIQPCLVDDHAIGTGKRRAGPLELGHGSTRVLEILEYHVVFLARRQVDGSAVLPAQRMR